MYIYTDARVCDPLGYCFPRGGWMVGFGSRLRWKSHQFLSSFGFREYRNDHEKYPPSPILNWLVDRYPGYPFCGLSWSQINSKGQFPHDNLSTSMNNAIVHGWNNHYQFDHVWSLFCGRAMTTPDLSGYVDGGVNLQPAKKCLQQSLCKSKRLGTMGR